MDFYLPDSGYVGRNPSDKAVDLSAPGPKNQRRIIRYVHGQMLSAWLVSDAPIDTSRFAAVSALEWKGPVLGPADGGWRAIGDALSWKYGHRSALYWRDRASPRTILVSRTPATGAYAVRRAEILKPGFASKASARLTGMLRKYVKHNKSYISGCLEYIVKPVDVRVRVQFDEQGRLSRIRADTDRSAPDVVHCLASAVIDVTGPPSSEGEFEVYRFH
jgi:hypothetical protein